MDQMLAPVTRFGATAPNEAVGGASEFTCLGLKIACVPVHTPLVPNQFLSAMRLGDAARVAMRIAVDSDAPQPFLFAAQLLIEAYLPTSNEREPWRDIDFRMASGGATPAVAKG